MSKLDDILDNFSTGVDEFWLDDGSTKDCKQDIKNLMLELIGEDEIRLHNGKETFEKMTWSGVRNEVRAELRQKVEKL